MGTVSRSKDFKRQKVLYGQTQMSIEDQLAIKKSVTKASNKGFNLEKETVKAELMDAELERATSIPADSSDLVVVVSQVFGHKKIECVKSFLGI